jgi:hypothetical protein
MQEIKGYYGTANEATIFEYNGWYAVQGSTNVNFTIDELIQGVNVENVRDLDFFEADRPIQNLWQFKEEVEDWAKQNDEAFS